MFGQGLNEHSGQPNTFYTTHTHKQTLLIHRGLLNPSPALFTSILFLLVSLQKMAQKSQVLNT